MGVGRHGEKCLDYAIRQFLPELLPKPRYGLQLVAHASKPAVSPTSKSADHTNLARLRVWKPATRQTWKSALHKLVGLPADSPVTADTTESSECLRFASSLAHVIRAVFFGVVLLFTFSASAADCAPGWSGQVLAPTDTL